MERKIKLETLNPYITCNLCKGYLIEATAITECLHAFCKSCLIKYLEDNTTCPTCKIVIHHSYPRQYINLDRTLQDIVYKLVPGLHQNEIDREKMFYRERGISYPKEDLAEGPVSPITVDDRREHEITNAPKIELINICLECIALNEEQLQKVYIRVPTKTTVLHIMKFAAKKFYGASFPFNNVEVLCHSEFLDQSDTMKFVYLTKWKNKDDVPFQLQCRPTYFG